MGRPAARRDWTRPITAVKRRYRTELVGNVSSGAEERSQFRRDRRAPWSQSMMLRDDHPADERRGLESPRAGRQYRTLHQILNSSCRHQRPRCMIPICA